MRIRSAATVAALVVVGVVLVAAAVGGTRALGRLELEYRPLFAMPGVPLEVVLLIAAALCIPVLLVGRLLRRLRRDQGAEPRWEWLRRLVSLAVVLAAVVALRALMGRQDPEGSSNNDGNLDLAAGGADVLGWSGWVFALALGLTIAAAAILVWRARTARHDAPATETPADDVRDALAAGRAALDDPTGDPRAAVVACYAAMEASLAAAGSGRRPAESPEELLARAVAEERLPAEPGRRLTRLFLAARYSSGAVTADDVTAGRDALQSIDAGVRS
jgi:hypothetical protein